MGQSWTVLDGQAGSGNGLASAQQETIREEEMVEVIATATSVMRGAAIRVVTAVVTAVVTSTVLGAVDEIFRRKLNMAVALG